MSAPGDPGYRPDQWGTAGDHEKRIRALEALLLTFTGAGLFFDFDNQGGYLDVTTNDTDGAGHGMLLADESGSGILISADGGSPAIDIESDGSRIEVEDAFGGVTITGSTLPTGGRITLNAGVSTVEADGEIIFRLPLATTLTVFDSGGNPIFRVDEDGDLHGKTGKALTFDL